MTEAVCGWFQAQASLTPSESHEEEIATLGKLDLSTMAKISNCVVEADVETATLWFMERNARFDHERPFLFTYPLEDGSFPSNLKHKSRDGITIRNLRNGVPSYEESGIGVLDLQTALEHDDYDDAEKVQTVLLPKVREALRLFLGAHSIHIIEYKVLMPILPWGQY